MTLRTAVASVLIAGASLTAPAARAQRPAEPIIDMHMHALPADEQGPPPLGMCTPFPEYAAWDPKTSYPDQFLAKFKKPACADPVWSPMTDAEVMNRTLAIADRRNIVGVLSGPAANVDAWIKTRPERFIPALSFQLGTPSTPTVEEHPKLRVDVMHAGYPLLDDMLAVLYAHPQVYVDVGIIVYNQQRPAFYRYLQALVDAGFGKRVMFGSDVRASALVAVLLGVSIAQQPGIA